MWQKSAERNCPHLFQAQQSVPEASLPEKATECRPSCGAHSRDSQGAVLPYDPVILLLAWARGFELSWMPADSSFDDLDAPMRPKEHVT
jgi:hypothetical protein